MISIAAALIWLPSVVAPPVEARPSSSLQFAQLTVRRQIIIRSVRIRALPSDGAAKMAWKEKKGPRCLQARTISGAALLGQQSVDLVLRNGTRLRARLASSCPALDYYYGFYITPGTDGMVCADRESIRSRAGGQCEIDAFRLLHAVPKRLTSGAP